MMVSVVQHKERSPSLAFRDFFFNIFFTFWK